MEFDPVSFKPQWWPYGVEGDGKQSPELFAKKLAHVNMLDAKNKEIMRLHPAVLLAALPLFMDSSRCSTSDSACGFGLGFGKQNHSHSIANGIARVLNAK